MRKVLIQNAVKNDFSMTLSFSYRNLNTMINVKERYTGGIIEITQSQLDSIMRSGGQSKLIDDSDNLRDLGDYIDKEFYGLDQLLENPVFGNFLPVLDELEENAIYNFELIDWFSGLGFEALGITLSLIHI